MRRGWEAKTPPETSSPDQGCSVTSGMGGWSSAIWHTVHQQGSLWQHLVPEGSTDTFKKSSAIHKPPLSVFWLSLSDGFAKSLSSDGSDTGCVNMPCSPLQDGPEVLSSLSLKGQDSSRAAAFMWERRARRRIGYYWALVLLQTPRNMHIYGLTSSSQHPSAAGEGACPSQYAVELEYEPRLESLLSGEAGNSPRAFHLSPSARPFLAPTVYTLLVHSFIYSIHFPKQAFGAK